jgi:hypothetical protein
LSYEEAKVAWEKDNDHYLFCHPRHGFIVKGTPDCLGYYVNEGFRRANCYLWYDPLDKCVYVCLRGPAKAHTTYELLTNYGTEGSAATFWTQQRIKLLDPATRRECEDFYNVKYTPPIVITATGEDGSCVGSDMSSVFSPPSVT